MPITLWIYIGKRFSLTLVMTILVIASTIALFDMVELFRVLPKHVKAIDVITLALLKNYSRLERAMPFLVMLSSMLTYNNLNKNSESVMCRSFGLSIWQLITPNLAISFAFGLMVLLFINPIGTFFHGRYEHMLTMITHNQNAPVSFSHNGIWLYQTDQNSHEKLILHAAHIIPEDNTLLKTMIFKLDSNGNFIKRIDADMAIYQNHNWLLYDARIVLPKLQHSIEPTLSIEVQTPLSAIADNILDPDSVSFLQLISLINSIKSAGFSVLKHQMQLSKMLLLPIFFMSMVMVGVCFTNELIRSNKAHIMQFIGILVGFAIYFLSDVFYALGAAGTLNIWFAACLPTLLCAICSGYYLLHIEES